jgi:F-type H+-transporting ATPase subunit delta
MEQNNSNIIRGYSKAIFAIANEFNAAISKEKFLFLLEFLSTVVKEPRIIKLINNSVLSVENKVDFLLTLTNSIMVSPLIENLIKLLVKNKHLLLIPKIYEYYDKLYLQSEDKLRVKIISAVLLDENQKKKLYKDLTAYFKKEVLLEYTVDGSIIAGIIIKYNDEVIDYSFKKKLLNLQHELLE